MENVKREYKAEYGRTSATLSLIGSEKIGISARYAASVVFARAGEEKAKVTYELMTSVSPDDLFRRLKMSDEGIEAMLSSFNSDPLGRNVDREVMGCIIRLQDQVEIPVAPL